MISIVLFIALVFRLFSLDQSFWLDEATQVLASRDRTFENLIAAYSVGDFHPPLYHAILWLWLRFVPATEIMARLPSVVIGVLTVWLTYRFARHFSRQVAILAALLLAISPLHIYYSQEARMYVLAAMLAVLSMQSLKDLMEKISMKSWLLYVGSSLCLLWTEYVPYLLFLAQPIFLYSDKAKLAQSFWRWILTAWAILVVSLLPWFPFFSEQLRIGRTFAQTVPAWGKIVGGVDWKTVPITLSKFVLGRFPIPDDIVGQVLIGLILLGWYGIISRAIFKPKYLLFFLWLVIPFFSGLVISLFVPIFSYFRFLYILPALCILYAAGVSTLSSKWRVTAVSFAIIVELAMSGAYFFDQSLQRENWRGMVKYVDTANIPVVFYLHLPPDPYRYYADNDRSINVLWEAANLSDRSVTKQLDRIMANDSFFLVPYLREISDPSDTIRRKIMMAGFQVSEARAFRGVGVIEKYTRQ